MPQSTPVFAAWLILGELTVGAYSWVGTIIASAALAYGAGKLLKISEPSTATALQGRTFVTRTAIESKKIIYGTAMVSGPMIYATNSGPNNEAIHIVIPLAGHECESIEQIFFNDQDAALEPFNSVINGVVNHIQFPNNTTIEYNHANHIRASGGLNYFSNYLGIYLHDKSPPDGSRDMSGFYIGTRETGDTNVQNDKLKVNKVTNGPSVLLAESIGQPSSFMPGIVGIAAEDDSERRFAEEDSTDSILYDREREFRTKGIREGLTVWHIGDKVQLRILEVQEDYIVTERATTSWSNQEYYIRWIPSTVQCGTVDLTHSYAKINTYLGEPNQSHNVDLGVDSTGNWNVDCTLDNTCALICTMIINPGVYPNGPPNIKALVKGRKVYDPRKDTRFGGVGTHILGSTSTYEWSDNWALCMLDYIMDAQFGLGATSDEIDWDAAICSANLSDEQIEYTPGSFVSRYSMNGVVDTGNSISNNIESMNTAAEGKVAFTQGKYRIYAANFDVPKYTLTTDDLRDTLSVQASIPRSELFNTVSGVFVDPEKDWQLTDFPVYPPKKKQSKSIYIKADGEVLDRNIELPFTTNGHQAQIIAKLILERARQGIIVNFPAKLNALKIGLLDTVYLHIPELGWGPTEESPTNPYKIFRVNSLAINPIEGVDLVLQEEACASYLYEFGDITVIDPAPDTGLVNPYYVAPPTNITYTTDTIHYLSDGSFVQSIDVSWEDNAAYSSHYILEYKVFPKGYSADQYPFKSEGIISQQFHTIVNTPIRFALIVGASYEIFDAIYVIRIKTVNTLGIESIWSEVGPFELAPSLIIPQAPTNFSVVSREDGTREFSWAHEDPYNLTLGFRISFYKNDTNDISSDPNVFWNSIYTKEYPKFGYISHSPYETNSDLFTTGNYFFVIKAITKALNSSGYPDSSDGVFAFDDPSTPVYLDSPRGPGVYYEYSEWINSWSAGEFVNCRISEILLRLIPDESAGYSWATLPSNWNLWTKWGNEDYISSFTYCHGDLSDPVTDETDAIDLGADISDINVNTSIYHSGIGTIVISWKWRTAAGAWNSWQTNPNPISSARYLMYKIDFSNYSGDTYVSDIRTTIKG